MKNKRLLIIVLICLCIALTSVFSIISSSLTFSDDDYIVYVPDGAPENIWIEKDIYYVTSQMSFEYAYELLLEGNYEQFKKVFFNSYNKFSDNSDVYYSMRKVFLKDKNEYSKSQKVILLSCVEELYEKECEKENNQFLTEKNIMLQIELNRSFGNYIQALSLNKLIEE